jgi:nucleoside phosphorylase
MKFLVVAAFDPELVRFRELAGALAWRRHPWAVEVLGVGVVDAAVEMTRCIASHAPSHALLLGTCGSLRAAAAPTGAVVCASRARLTAEAGAELPPQMRTEQALDPALHAALVAAGARSVVVANTVGVTTDDLAAARLAESADVEHLEAFAFARACTAHGIAGGVVLGVANAVGSRGRAEWRANHLAASARAADLAWRLLSRGFAPSSRSAR